MARARPKENVAGVQPSDVRTPCPNANGAIKVYQPTIGATTEKAKRYKCPVHHGKNRSVAVGFINGRAWAKCWSQGCASADILAALNLSNNPSIPWTPIPPRLRPAFSVEPLTPVSHTQAVDYLSGNSLGGITRVWCIGGITRVSVCNITTRVYVI